MFRKIRQTIAIVILAAFITTSVKSPAYAQSAQQGMVPRLPQPGVMVHLSPGFTPAHLQGITIHPDNALQFDFLIRKSDQDLEGDQKKEEYKKLVKYFLASLTIPDEDQWVNLSPYEKDRIIKDDFGKTEMGRDLLAQDYLLKQITSSLIYPEDGLGKKFWDKIYERAWNEYHTTNIPVNTFNKVWIVPDQAYVYESGNTAYILQSHLKVMLEEDYLSLEKHSGATSSPISTVIPAKGRIDRHSQLLAGIQTNTIGSQVIREIILPELEKEVNEGKNFSNLRQMYSGMILATWYKKALKESLLGKVYADKAKVKGVDQDPKANEAIYQRYLKAFKKGVFNYIKEDVDKYTNEAIPRKYFSGGFNRFDPAMAGRGDDVRVIHRGDPLPAGLDMAALASESSLDRAIVALNASADAVMYSKIFDRGFHDRQTRALEHIVKDLTYLEGKPPADVKNLIIIGDDESPAWGSQIIRLGIFIRTLLERWPKLENLYVVTASPEIVKGMDPRVKVVMPGDYKSLNGNLSIQAILNLGASLDGEKVMERIHGKKNNTRLINDLYFIWPTFGPAQGAAGEDYRKVLRVYFKKVAPLNEPLLKGKREEMYKRQEGPKVFFINPFGTTNYDGIENLDTFAKRWAALIAELIQKGETVKLSNGGFSNPLWSDAIMDRLYQDYDIYGDKVKDLVLKFKSKMELVDYMAEHAKAVITLDSGPFHVAYELLGIPTLVLTTEHSTAWIPQEEAGRLGRVEKNDFMLPGGENIVIKKLSTVLNAGSSNAAKTTERRAANPDDAAMTVGPVRPVLRVSLNSQSNAQGLVEAQTYKYIVLDFNNAFAGQDRQYREREILWELKSTGGFAEVLLRRTLEGDIPEGIQRVMIVSVLRGTDYNDLKALAKELAIRAGNMHVDTAMMGSKVRDRAALAKQPSIDRYGGIDLNSANLNLQIKRDGNGVPLPLALQDMAQLSRIQGFEPEIIEIKPAVNLPILSELQQKLQSSAT